MSAYVEKTLLEPHTCGSCGILFAAPEKFWAERHESRKTWFCPNGHPRVFTGPSEAQKLKDELARKEQMLESAQARAVTAEQERAQVTKAHKKMRERVMNGMRPYTVPLTALREALPAPVVPQIDYTKLIHDCFQNTKQASGTLGCRQFARGAEWFREQLIAATPQPKETP